jgi:hypothetical protein
VKAAYASLGFVLGATSKIIEAVWRTPSKGEVLVHGPD